MMIVNGVGGQKCREGKIRISTGSVEETLPCSSWKWMCSSPISEWSKIINDELPFPRILAVIMELDRELNCSSNGTVTEGNERAS